MARPHRLVLITCCLCLLLPPLVCPSPQVDHDSSTPAPITIQNDFQVVIDSDNAIQLQRRNGQPIGETSLTSYDGLGDYSLAHSQDDDYDHEERLSQLNQAIDLQRLTPGDSNSATGGHFKPIDSSPLLSTSSPATTTPPSAAATSDSSSLSSSSLSSSSSKTDVPSKDENTSKSSIGGTPTVTASPKSFIVSNTEPANIFANQNVFLAKPITAHRHLKSLPSFSKMPDHVFTQLHNNEIADSSASFSEDTPSYAPMKPLVVPTGSRVHTIKYLDYPETVVSSVVSTPKSSTTPSVSTSSSSSPSSSSMNDDLSDSDLNSKPFEPVIELTGSRPVLPIVFNFRTSSSPIMSKTNLKALYSDDVRPTTKPKTKYYKSEKAPEYSRQVVHKPIQIAPAHKSFKPSLHYDNDYSNAMAHSPAPLSTPPTQSYYPYKMPKFSSVEYAHDYDFMPGPATAFNKFNYPFYSAFNAPQTPIYVPDTTSSYSSSGPASYLSSFFYPLAGQRSLYHSAPNYPSQGTYPAHTPTYLSSPSFFQNRYTTYHSPMAESTQYFTQAFPFVDADYVNLAAFNRYK